MYLEVVIKHSEVFKLIEDQLTNLKIRSPVDGLYLEGLEAIHLIHEFEPFELATLENRLYEGGDPTAYLDGMLKLIHRFKTRNMKE